MQVWKEVVEMKIRNKINCVGEIKNLNYVREKMHMGMFYFTKKHFDNDVQYPCKDPNCIYKKMYISIFDEQGLRKAEIMGWCKKSDRFNIIDYKTKTETQIQANKIVKL